MKIVQIVHSFPPRYEGIGNYCYQLSKHLAERGHQVDVFTSRLHNNLPVEEFIDGFTIHRCPYFGKISTNRITFILNKLLNIKADIIHAHSYIFLTSNQAALAKKINQQPLLLHLHGGVKVIPNQGSLLNRLQFNSIKNIYDQTIGKWTIQAANKIASVSKIDIELARELWNIDSNKIDWLPNAIDINSFDGNNHNDNLNVVFIGRLETWKGVHTFIEVASNILEERDDVTFTVVGDGSLRNQVENNGYTSRINVLGCVPHNQIPKILSNASILALPSYMEGLPTVCLEALASEIPVVASDVGGTSEIVIEKETGFLAPPGNAKIFAYRIMTLLDDEKLRKKMGRNGRKLIEKHYTWDKVVEKTEKLYRKTLS